MIIDTEKLRKELKQFDTTECNAIDSNKSDITAIRLFTSAETRSISRNEKIEFIESLWEAVNNNTVKEYINVTLLS